MFGYRGEPFRYINYTDMVNGQKGGGTVFAVNVGFPAGYKTVVIGEPGMMGYRMTSFAESIQPEYHWEGLITNAFSDLVVSLLATAAVTFLIHSVSPGTGERKSEVENANE